MKLKKAFTNFFLSSIFYNYLINRTQLREISFAPPDPWPGDPVLGENLFQGYYNFAGKKVFSPKDPVWKVSERDINWQSEMNSFFWLRHLKARSGSLARRHARYLISNWIEINNRWNEKSWQIDILARRVSSWITNIGFLLAEKDEDFSLKIRKSLLKQIKHLNNFSNRRYFASLDKDFGIQESAIKKVQIIRGLLLSIICFSGQEVKIKKTLALLEAEILNDLNQEGIHKSRSPYTQLAVLADLITIRDTLVTANLDVPMLLNDSVKKMSHALRFFRNINGTLAIFNGSKKGEKFVIDKILSEADGKVRAKGPTSLSESGFEKLSVPNVNIFIDTLSSKNNILSKRPHTIEIGVGKSRLLGSCGSIYGKNEQWKKLLMSSSAHSTLILDDTNAFSGIDTKQQTYTKRYKKDGSEIIELIHYGYYNRYSAICSRILELGEDGKNIAGLDEIISEKLKTFAIRFHLSPDIKISLSRDNKSAIIATDEQGWIFIFEGDVDLHLDASIFVEDNGKISNSNQLVLNGQTTDKKTSILWGFKRKS